MNKLYLIISFGISACLFLSCGQGADKTEKVNERAYQLSGNSQSGEFSMQQSSAKGDVTIGEAAFRYQIDRAPSSQLPKVKDEQGNIFVDNEIALNITRNGKTVLTKRFTKRDFSSQVASSFLSKAIREGLVFDKVVNGKMRFAASVCHPQTDLFVPLCVLVSTDGSVRIDKGSVLEDEIPGRNP